MDESVVQPVVMNDSVEHNSNIKNTSITSQKYLMSAALITDAKDGLLLLNSCSDHLNVKIYYLYRHSILQYTLYCAIFLHHFITLFENINDHNNSNYQNISTSIEFLCLIIYTIRLSHLLLITPSPVFWCDKKNIITASVIFMTICDIIISFLVKGYIRWSIILRPLFIINFAENKQIRRAFRNIRNTLPDVLNVLILFFLSILTFSIIGLKLFEKQTIILKNGDKNETYFSDFPDIFYNLYVLVTTANNPDIMMPAYNKSRWFAIYFVVYLITNLYLFMNIILAVIYNNYRKHLKTEVRNLLNLKRENLLRAFNLLTNSSENSNLNNDKEFSVKGITNEMFNELMQLVLRFEGINQYIDRLHLISIYWSLLETNQIISKENFLQLSELLSFDIKITSNARNITVIEKLMKSLYQSNISRMFRLLVKSKIFRYCFDCLILLNAILIAFDLDYSYVEWSLLLVFTFEILAKLYTFGFYLFIQKFWNIFDLIVIGMAVILWLIIEFNHNTKQELEQYLDLLLILRVLRLCKIITTIKRFKVVVKTVIALVPSFGTYIGLLFVVYYCYAIIGMRLFENPNDDTDNNCKYDSIHCCSKDQTISANYCSINFKTFPNAMLFLFDLMVVNQWHVLAKNQELLRGTKFTRVYFMSFHLICVILVLNIFTAFVLEAFILEYMDITDQKHKKTIFQQRLEQIGLNCAQKRKQSVINSSYTEIEDLVDADHDFIDNNYCMDFKHEYNSSDNTLNINDLRIVITEKKSVELLLIKMFRNEISIESKNIDQISTMS